jgi:predicted secreted protein
MSALHGGLARFFSLLLDPVGRLTPVVGLTLISAVSGVIALLAFRVASDPAAVRAARQRAQAHLLAVRLYRDDLRVVMRSQRSLLGALAAYFGNMLLPFLALLLPFGLLFAHLEARYGARALHPGERTLVTVSAAPATLDQWRLEGNDGLVVDSAPVRIPARGEIVWRVRATASGRHQIALVAGDRRIEAEALVTGEDRGAAPGRSIPTLSSLFLAPTEPQIPAGLGISSIEIGYPPLQLAVFGWRLHWIVIFLVVSAAAALLLRKRAGVEF